MIQFANVDRDSITGSAASAYHRGEVDANPTVVLRNIAWTINLTLSWYRSGYSVSLVVDGGEITGLKVKGRKRRVIPLAVRGDTVLLSGEKYHVVSSGGASALADAILSKIEAAHDAE